MSRLFYHVMQDNLGNLLFDVTGTMRLAGTGTAATIYGDEALTIPIANPMTNHPSFGSFKCFLGAGDYDFYMAKGGYTFETLTGVQGHGTMAQQDAGAVAITGGSGAFTTGLSSNGANTNLDDTTLQVSVAQHRVNINPAGGTAPGLDCVPPAYFRGYLGVQTPATSNTALALKYVKAAQYGMTLQPSDGDTGNYTISFLNAVGGIIGTITTTGAATAYNTSSDVRLKHAITALTGALDRVRALRPVHYLWRANDEPGDGFLAHELMQHIPAAVTGEPDAMDAAGNIQPQGVDHSKLVPWLTAALQETMAQVQALTARVAVLEEALVA